MLYIVPLALEVKLNGTVHSFGSEVLIADPLPPLSPSLSLSHPQLTPVTHKIKSIYKTALNRHMD